MGIRALFGVLCLGVSVFVFGLCVKFAETCIATGRISCHCCCSLAWTIVSISIGYVKLFAAVGTIPCVGCCSYR